MPTHPILLPIYEELFKLPVVTTFQDNVTKTIKEKRPMDDTYTELILKTTIFDRF